MAVRDEIRQGRSSHPLRRLRSRTGLPVLACKGDFIINPTKEQLDGWL